MYFFVNVLLFLFNYALLLCVFLFYLNPYSGMKSIRTLLLNSMLFLILSTTWISCDKNITYDEVPVVTTSEISDILQTSAVSGGSLADDGGEEISARGICFSTDSLPDIDDQVVLAEGIELGNFTCSMNRLISDTSYFVRAFATNSNGTGYGLTVKFSTREFVSGQRLVLQPGAEDGVDALIGDLVRDSMQYKNYGAHPVISPNVWTTSGIQFILRGLLKFDLESINPATPVKSARLSLYGVSYGSMGTGHAGLDDATNEFWIYRIVVPWQEDKVTWLNQPAVVSDMRIKGAPSTSELQDYSFDVTSMVRNMVAHPEENNGWMFQLVIEEKYRRLMFGSSDFSDPTKHPKLEIEF